MEVARWGVGEIPGKGLRGSTSAVPYKRSKILYLFTQVPLYAVQNGAGFSRPAGKGMVLYWPAHSGPFLRDFSEPGTMLIQLAPGEIKPAPAFYIQS